MIPSVSPPFAPDLPPHAEAPELRAIRDWVSDRLGLHFERHVESFQQRVASFCRERDLVPRTLLAGLERERPSLVTSLAEDLSTNHTSFFREPEAFELFEREILPTLPARGPIRIWSAAASSGEEAYSLAFTLRDALGVEADRARILGTDLSRKQVRRAETGRYPRFLHPSDESFTSRFLRTEDELIVPDAVRSMCVFRTMNLTRHPWPFKQQFHVVFLRNVLYYFDTRVQRRVVEACYDVTAPGGWLVTSLTEPLLDLHTRWERLGPGVHRRGDR